MKKVFLSVFIGMFCVSCIALFTGGDITVVSEGKTQAKIVIAENPASVAQFAAFELREHIEKMTGVKLPIITDGAVKEGDYPIYIGGGTSLAKGVNVEELPEQGCLVDVDEKRTILIGRDSSRTNKVTIIYGDNPGIVVRAHGIPSVWEKRGSLDAVYSFLDRVCGVKWLDCTEAGTSLPKSKNLIVNADKFVDSPFVRCRDAKINPEEWDRRRDAEGFLNYQRTAWPACAAAAKNDRDFQNRINLCKNVFALRLRIGGEKIHCNHSLYWFYDRYYWKDHNLFIESKPEWFSKHLKRQKKARAEGSSVYAEYDTSFQPAQMCYSNEEFLKQVVQDVRDYFNNGGYTNRFSNQGVPCSAKNPVATWGKDVYAIEPMDNSGFCECPKCLSQYRPERKVDRAECSDYWFRFVNKVAKEIKKSHPDKQISTLAYGPRREGLPSFPVEDNVVVHFCWDANRCPNREPLMTKQMDLMRKWRAAYPDRPLGLWLYNGFPHESGSWWKYIPPPGFFGELFDKEMKFIRDLDIRECIFNCGLKDDFELFLGGRLMWNPSEDYKTLKSDYFSAFGPAEKQMRKFYDFIEDRYCNTNYYGGHRGHLNKKTAYEKLFTKREFAILESIINEAEAVVAKDGTAWHKQRVKNWRVGYWDLLLSSRFKKMKYPDPAKGVTLKSTECYYGSSIPLGGVDVLAGLPFSIKGTGGGSLLIPNRKKGDSPNALYDITSEKGFQGYWNGKFPTQLVYRCNVKIGKLKRFRIVTYDIARSVFLFDLIGWKDGKRVTLLENVNFPTPMFGQGCMYWDIDFSEEVAPRDLDAIGINDKFWNHKKLRCSPRYFRIMAVDAENPEDETASIQKRIDDAWKAGGGVVRLKEGVHNISALRLRSGVTLYLEKNCVLKASRDAHACDNLLLNDKVDPVPSYELFLDGVSSKEYLSKNLPMRPYLYGHNWNNSVIWIYRAENCGIVGEEGSVIDGVNCADSRGSEGYRGPHTISVAVSTNIFFKGYTVKDSANYAHSVTASGKIKFDNVTIYGGHDGAHFREVDNIRIKNCTFFAGDDAVAGRANTDVIVTNCVLNSACSPIRFGGTDVLFTDCTVKGPNTYPHRYTLTKTRQLLSASPEPGEGRRNIGCFMQYFTGEDIKLRKKPGNMVIKNFKIENPGRFMVLLTGLGALWQTGPAIDKIRFENVEVTGIERPSAIWAPEDTPLTLEFVNCKFSFKKKEPYAFTGKFLKVKAENTVFENASKVYEEWKGDPDKFIKTAVPEFPSWSFENPEADLR